MISQRQVVVMFGALYLCLMFYLHYKNNNYQLTQHTQQHDYHDEKDDLNNNNNNNKKENNYDNNYDENNNNNNHDENNNNNNHDENNNNNKMEIEENMRRVELITSTWNLDDVTGNFPDDLMNFFDLKDVIEKVKTQNKDLTDLKLKLLDLLADDRNDADNMKRLLRNFKEVLNQRGSGEELRQQNMREDLYDKVLHIRKSSKGSSLDYNIPQHCKAIIGENNNKNNNVVNENNNGNKNNKNKNNNKSSNKNNIHNKNNNKTNVENSGEIFWRQSYEANTKKAFKNIFKFQKLSTSIHVYSAFYDDRNNDFDNKLNVSYVRIMTVKNFAQVPLYCVFQQQQQNNQQNPQQQNNQQNPQQQNNQQNPQQQNNQHNPQQQNNQQNQRKDNPQQQNRQQQNQHQQQHSKPDPQQQHKQPINTQQQPEEPLLFVSKISRTYEMNENHKRPFGGYILSCQVPEELQHPPCHVSLFDKDPADDGFDWDVERGVILPVLVLKAESTKLAHKNVGESSNTTTNAEVKGDKESDATEMQTELKHTFTICVPPLHGHVSRRQLIEFIEFTLLLGFDKIFFYVYEVDADIIKLLEYYSVHRRVIEVLPWLLPIEKLKVWYNAQIISVQDCLYRNMAMSEFVLFSDLDEILVPRSTIVWPTLLPLLRHPEWCAFSFNAAYFVPGRVEQCGEEIKLECVNVLNTIMRTKMTDKDRTKCMVKPRLLFESGIHHVSKPLFSHYKISQINQSIALLHHYRDCRGFRTFRRCNQKVEDKHAHIYSRSLLHKIQQVREEVQLWEGLNSENNGEKKTNKEDKDEDGVFFF